MTHMTQETEVSLKAFINSVWFKGLSRGAMIITPLLVAGFAGAWAIVTGNTAADLVEAQVKLEAVQSLQAQRAVDGETFQTEVRGSVSELKAELDAQGKDLFTMRVDVGVIKRLLQSREDVADAVTE